MEMELVARAVPHRRRRQRGRDVRVPAGRLRRGRSDMDVADRRGGAAPVRPLPGRDGHRDGRDRDPARARRRRRRVARHPVRVRRAATRSTTPTRSSRCSGLTGIPFTDVYNGCATAASALTLAAQHDPARRPRPRHRGRHGQAPARCVQRRSAPVRVPVVVRRGRAVPHHEVLRDEDQQVHARPRDLARRRSPRSRRRTTATAR